MSTDNRFGCTPSTWKKFSEFERTLYNNLRARYELDHYFPRELRQVSTVAIRDTLYHNMACEAAWAARALMKETLGVQ